MSSPRFPGVVRAGRFGGSGLAVGGEEGAGAGVGVAVDLGWRERGFLPQNITGFTGTQKTIPANCRRTCL